MTKYGEMSLEYKPRAKRNTYAVFVIVVIIAVAVAIVIGFFIGKSVGENASRSPSQTTVIPNYLDSSEFEALRKRVNEGVSTQRLRDNLKWVYIYITNDTIMNTWRIELWIEQRSRYRVSGTTHHSVTLHVINPRNNQYLKYNSLVVKIYVVV